MVTAAKRDYGDESPFLIKAREMSAKSSLSNALSSIDDAKRKLKKLRQSENAEIEREIKRVVRELEDAEGSINQALRDVRRAE